MYKPGNIFILFRAKAITQKNGIILPFVAGELSGMTKHEKQRYMYDETVLAVGSSVVTVKPGDKVHTDKKGLYEINKEQCDTFGIEHKGPDEEMVYVGTEGNILGVIE